MSQSEDFKENRYNGIKLKNIEVFKRNGIKLIFPMSIWATMIPMSNSFKIKNDDYLLRNKKSKLNQVGQEFIVCWN